MRLGTGTGTGQSRRYGWGWGRVGGVAGAGKVGVAGGGVEEIVGRQGTG